MSEDERPPEPPQDAQDEHHGVLPWVSVTGRESVLQTLGAPPVPRSPEDVELARVMVEALVSARDISVTGVRGREVDLRFPDGSQHTAVLKRPPGRPRRPPNAQALPPAGKLAQQTSAEVKTVAAGLADGPKGRNWQELEGEASLMHRVDDRAPLMTVVRGGPLLDWLGMPATVAGLREELRAAGLPAVLLFHVLIGGSLKLIERNRVYVTVAIDDLITAIGWRPRSTAEREGMRRRVWRWLALFDAAEVIGCRPGTYRDPLTREAVDLTSRDALLRVVGRREPAQLAFDDSAPPLEVTYVAGPWVERFRGNHRVLTFYKVDVRRLAAIPSGKPSGAWAQAIGLALHQKWRERAADPRGPGTVTRRELLDLFPPEPSLDDILGSDTPHRARDYWRDAIGLLKQEHLVGYYRELGTLEDKRQGWGAAWADQPLDVRAPAGEARDGVAEIAARAAEVRTRSRRRRPARGKDSKLPE